jgi:hypothetical protein
MHKTLIDRPLSYKSAAKRAEKVIHQISYRYQYREVMVRQWYTSST